MNVLQIRCRPCRRRSSPTSPCWSHRAGRHPRGIRKGRRHSGAWRSGCPWSGSHTPCRCWALCARPWRFRSNIWSLPCSRRNSFRPRLGPRGGVYRSGWWNDIGIPIPTEEGPKWKMLHNRELAEYFCIVHFYHTLARLASSECPTDTHLVYLGPTGRDA